MLVCDLENKGEEKKGKNEESERTERIYRFEISRKIRVYRWQRFLINNHFFVVIISKDWFIMRTYSLMSINVGL